MQLTQPTTRTLEAPGATLTYDLRPGTGGDIPLFLIGSPMGAAGFGSLASHFPERTIITYDPRGAERSTKADPSTESNPGQHADDLHRIIQEVGGPVDLFASSGGAVNALALVAKHPEDVRKLVAHEPPLASVLPDAENAKAAVRAISDSYQRGGFGAGMAHFMAITSHRGPFPDDIARRATGGFDPNRDRRGYRVGRRDGESRRPRGRRATRDRACDLPEPPRRLPGRRVRLARGAGRIRRQAARRPGGRGLTDGPHSHDLPLRAADVHVPGSGRHPLPGRRARLKGGEGEPPRQVAAACPCA